MGSINHEPRGGFFGLFLPLSALQSKDRLSGYPSRYIVCSGRDIWLRAAFSCIC